MKKQLIFLILIFASVNLFSQSEMIVKSNTDTAKILMIDSCFYLKIDGKDYLKIQKNKTVQLMGKAEAWDDMRVPVTSTLVDGSNPPVFSSLKNSGGEYIGTAQKFDGIDDYDSIPASKVLNFLQTDFSIGFWIQPEPGLLNDSKILYKKGGWNIGIYQEKIRVYLEGKEVFLSNVELNMGGRNYVLISVKNNATSCNLNVYVNNKFAGKQNYFSKIIDNTSHVYIGKPESKGYGNNYKGVLDELNFWNKVLTTEERDSLWNNSKGTVKNIAKSNLVLGFSFNDIETQIQSSNNNSPLMAYSTIVQHTPDIVQGLVSETIISHGVYVYYFNKDNLQELFFTAQLPHSWIEGSDIEPHVHYVRPNSDTGTVVWGLEYTWTNIGDIFADTKTIYSYNKTKASSNDQQIYSSFGMVNGTGKTISSMIVCRIFRDAENPLDTYNYDVGLLEVDFHIRNNSLGSSGITKK